MNGKTIIPIKIDPSPAQQVKDPDNYTLRETTEVDIKQVFKGRPHNQQLWLCIQWPQSERLIINAIGIITKSWTQNSYEDGTIFHGKGTK